MLVPNRYCTYAKRPLSDEAQTEASFDLHWQLNTVFSGAVQRVSGPARQPPDEPASGRPNGIRWGVVVAMRWTARPNVLAQERPEAACWHDQQGVPWSGGLALKLPVVMAFSALLTVVGDLKADAIRV